TAALERPWSLLRSASVPTAVLSWPSVLSNIAAVPTAVSFVATPGGRPVVRASAPAPTPVLKAAPFAKKSENQPIHVFPMPLGRSTRARALHPSAVVKEG